MQIIGTCKEVRGIDGKPTTEVLDTVSKRQAKSAMSKWQKTLGPGWKITSRK
jgi:hypothetical protein